MSAKRRKPHTYRKIIRDNSIQEEVVSKLNNQRRSKHKSKEINETYNVTDRKQAIS